jgi:hypothetical protein
MAMNDFTSDDAPRTPATKKKPYEKPTFRYEQVFVTSALSCGKIAGESLICNSANKAS